MLHRPADLSTDSRTFYLQSKDAAKLYTCTLSGVVITFNVARQYFSDAFTPIRSYSLVLVTCLVSL